VVAAAKDGDDEDDGSPRDRRKQPMIRRFSGKKKGSKEPKASQKRDTEDELQASEVSLSCASSSLASSQANPHSEASQVPSLPLMQAKEHEHMNLEDSTEVGSCADTLLYSAPTEIAPTVIHVPRRGSPAKPRATMALD
jgi:hypothetical protein